MGEKTMESKAKTKNGIKRVVFSGIAILLEIIFLLNFLIHITLMFIVRLKEIYYNIYVNAFLRK